MSFSYASATNESCATNDYRTVKETQHEQQRIGDGFSCHGHRCGNGDDCGPVLHSDSPRLAGDDRRLRRGGGPALRHPGGGHAAVPQDGGRRGLRPHGRGRAAVHRRRRRDRDPRCSRDHPRLAADLQAADRPHRPGRPDHGRFSPRRREGRVLHPRAERGKDDRAGGDLAGGHPGRRLQRAEPDPGETGLRPADGGRHADPACPERQAGRVRRGRAEDRGRRPQAQRPDAGIGHHLQPRPGPAGVDAARGERFRRRGRPHDRREGAVAARGAEHHPAGSRPEGQGTRTSAPPSTWRSRTSSRARPAPTPNRRSP